MIPIQKTDIRITPSSERTLIRPFIPGNPSQVDHILFRIFSMDRRRRAPIMQKIYDRIEMPDENLNKIFINHFNHVQSRIPSNLSLSDEDKIFIGAFFTQQYALESTAMFNPSIVLHPQQDVPNTTKFIMSLRAIGEGHISSIIFREGLIDKDFNIILKPNSPVIYEPQRDKHTYEREQFEKIANDMGILSISNMSLFRYLPRRFNLEQLEEGIARVKNSNITINNNELENSLNNIRMLALSNFTVKFEPEDISQCAIYPASPSQSNGLEDARFVQFKNADGTSRYYATFTAYNGQVIVPEMMETDDFREFRISTLNGAASSNKGMALFPRLINGNYVMLGRQDNESLYIMKSDNPYFWYDYQPLIKPTYDWELIQLGNCGSPLEIEEGWLVITHGVGAIRSYSLSAILLDKRNPAKVIGRLHEPILSPDQEEERGYVPNVLYTCGGLVIGRTLVLPYAIGDVITTFALIQIDDILSRMIQ